MNPIASFFIGLICTGALFLLCLVTVVGGKMLFLSFKERFFPKKPAPAPPPPKKTVIKRQRKPVSAVKPVRSIEIDPEQIDKIYVKKSS